MINLPDVTLVTVSSVHVDENISALNRCFEKIKFYDVKIITNEKPVFLSPEIKFEKCELLDDINKYNSFMFSEVGKYVESTHALVIQQDSWVINHKLWDNEWLNYDYIGAPWRISQDAYICHATGEHVRVGNGGFSLRSKKLLDIPKKHNLPLLQEQGWYNEDGNICVYHRVKMLELGVKYAPVDVASKFSFETYIPENLNIIPFGFHKNYPLGRVLYE